MTIYTKQQLVELEEGWYFYDHAWCLLHHILGNISGNSLLDVGCGTGMALALIKAAKPWIEVQGLDNTNNASEIWQSRGLNVEIGSAVNLPFKDNSYDTVLSSHVIEHLEDDLKAVQEIIRVFNKRAIIIVPSGNVDEKNPGTPHLRYYDRINFKDLIIKATNDKNLTSHVYSLPHSHISNLIAIVEN